MDIQSFIGNFEQITGYKVKKTGTDQYVTRCPVHDDHSPSLSIGYDGQKILIHCFSSCSVESIVGSVGLKMSDLFDNKEERTYKVLRTFDYYDIDSTYICSVERSTIYPKGIPVRKDENGNKIFGISEGDYYFSNGTWKKIKEESQKSNKWRHFTASKRVLYNVQELIKRKNDIIFLASGERNAQDIIDRGLLAVSNISGESSWDNSYNSFFRGRKVIILEDNDETGLKRSERLKNTLSAFASDIKVLKIGTGEPHSDVSDWLGAGHSAEELLDLALGVTLPASRAVEESVLSTIFKNNKLITSLIELSATKLFFFSEFRLIAQAMVDCFEKNQKIDKITVGDALGRKRLLQIGGYEVLEELHEKGKVLDSISDYISILSDKSEARNLIAVADRVVYEAQNTKDIKGLKDRIATQLIKVAPSKNSPTSANEVAEDFLLNYDKQSKGLLTGFTELDFITNGLQNTDLIVLAAVEKSGKSSLALNIADYVATQGLNVLFYSMEMSKVQLVKKLISSRSMVNLKNIINGQMSSEELIRIHSSYREIPKTLLIDDSPGLSIPQIRAKNAQFKANNNNRIDLIILDYIQLGVTEGKSSTQEEIDFFTRNLKIIAKEEECPLIALSQLSRPSETNFGKAPTTRSLRGSGSINQHLDQLYMIHRPELFDPSPENQGLVELIISGRNVESGTVNLAFLGSVSKFENLI